MFKRSRYCYDDTDEPEQSSTASSVRKPTQTEFRHGTPELDPTRSGGAAGPGLLELPPELADMIFSHISNADLVQVLLQSM